MTFSFTAVYQSVEEGGFVAFVEELPGANTQGETLEEARENLREAVELILETNRELVRETIDSEAIREEILVKA
jgi:predicted RNase H-like HicB family nuclease